MAFDDNNILITGGLLYITNNDNLFAIHILAFKFMEEIYGRTKKSAIHSHAGIT